MRTRCVQTALTSQPTMYHVQQVSRCGLVTAFLFSHEMAHTPMQQT